MRVVGLDELAETERRSWDAVEGAPISDAVHALCRALGNVTACASLIDLETGLGIGRGFAHLDPALVDLIAREFSTPETNPVLRSMPYWSHGVLHHNRSLLDLRKVRRTAFYNDWWVPTGVGDDAGALMLSVPDGRMACFMFGCLGTREWLDGDERRFAEAAAGSIARALRTLAAFEHERASATLKGREPDPAWLLGAEGMARCSNGSAERLVETPGAPVYLRRNRIVLSDPEANERVLRSVNAVLAGKGSGGTVRVLGRTGPFTVMISPGPSYRGEHTALMTLQPLRPIDWTAAELSAAYELTPREAAVAVALAQGTSPIHIARKLGIAPESVRMYLKRVFSKTGAHGQVALVALLLRSSPNAG